MGKEVKLTKARRETLEHCPDWSAPFEIAYRRHEATGEIVSLLGTEQAIGWLRNQGLVEFGWENGTYRQTPAGLAALEANRE
jgi:hypothetical protein